ncbi:MAG TPA: selenium-binding protein SBP56-related protein, partial [Gemmatimonadales bacterium]|nr:selenium-binding protein SBP56-related protein [Gemmatimonadales bacterium]
MARWRPDPTFYASPRDAARAPAEELGYVALLDPTHQRPDAMGVVDLNPRSTTYASLVGRTHLPNIG